MYLLLVIWLWQCHGNLLTQIVTTLLITFLIPISVCYFDLFGGSFSTIESATNFSTVKSIRNYTAPSMFFGCTVNDMKYQYNKISIYKMLILSIVYIVIGYVIFKKKKMEYAGESFENKYVHLVVKGLTLVPFVMILVLVVDSYEWEALAFLMTIILVYYLIYDMVTGKRNKILVNLCAMVTSVLILFGIYSAIQNISENFKISINYDEIEMIVLDDVEGIFSNLDIEIKDKELINEIINNSFFGRVSVQCVLKLSNGSTKNFRTYLNEAIVEKMLAEASVEEFKIVNIEYNSVDKATSKKLKSALNKSTKENSVSYLYQKILNDEKCINTYEYKDHKIKRISYPITISKDVFEIITKSENQSVAKLVESNYEDYIYFYVDDLEISYHGDCPKEIKKFILENNNACDIDKNYIILHIAGECFYTNEIEKVKYIIENLEKNIEYYEIEDSQVVETMSI